MTGAAETSERTLRTDEPAVEEGDEEVPAAGADITLPMADLPRGARFGTLVHEIFEHVPFDSPDLESHIRTELDVELQRSSWDFDSDAFVTGDGGGHGNTARPPIPARCDCVISTPPGCSTSWRSICRFAPTRVR